MSYPKLGLAGFKELAGVLFGFITYMLGKSRFDKTLYRGPDEINVGLGNDGAAHF